jgi:hypothetical protein
MPSIDALADRLSTYLGNDQVNLVRRAYFYAEQAHDGQRRRSGEAYVTHPLAVANILADMHMDHQSLMAAMLHDVIEDTGIAKEALQAQFGETVAELVDGVSKLTQMNFETKAEAQAENFQKMAMAMARDIRVILVKLADRLHNMRTLEVLSGEKRRRIAKETLKSTRPSPTGWACTPFVSSSKTSASRPCTRCVPRASTRRSSAPGATARKSSTRSKNPWPLPGHRRHRGRGQRTAETPLRHLQEDARQAPGLQRDHGRLRVPDHRRQGRHLLPRAGRCA